MSEPRDFMGRRIVGAPGELAAILTGTGMNNGLVVGVVSRTTTVATVRVKATTAITAGTVTLEVIAVD